jgi:large subunit ribosomal protein L9
MHDVKIALHPEVAVTVHVNVARSPEEAELQAQGIDVIQAMFEEQAAPIAAEALAAEPEGEEVEAEVSAEETSEEAPVAAAEGEAEQG